MKTVSPIYHFFIFFLVGAYSTVSAQPENKFIRRGNDAFEKGDFKKAEIDYRKALEKNIKSTKGTYNLGGAIYQQESFEDAANLYGSLAESNISAEEKAKSFHNLGNSQMNMQQFDAAIESYKNALRNNPGDMETKYNLEYAKKMLQQQEQQQNQENKDKQDKDEDKKQDQEQKQDQQKQDEKDKQKQDQDQKQKQDQKQDQQQNQDQQKQQQQQQKQISKEDAERILQALKENEKKTLEKLKLEKLKNARRVKTEKDW